MNFQREYQDKALAGILFAFQQNQSPLIVMATGTGKTHVIANTIQAVRPKRAMVLAHRDELIWQAKSKIEQITGLSVAVEKAGYQASTDLFGRADVIVSSIQTQVSGKVGNRRYKKFDPDTFGLLVADEAHHSVSHSWTEAIAHYRQNPNLHVLGVTATADRADNESLGKVFDTVAFEYGILDAINDGYLVPVTQQFFRVESIDLSHVKTTCGDLNEGQLARIVETEENILGICQPSLEVMFALPPKSLNDVPVPQWRDFLISLRRTPRRTIMFCVSVAQAEMCSKIFERAMDGVEWVCGKTRDEDRKAILKRFSMGETHVVCNCSVLGEGYDNPAVEVIVMARPTKSRGLYTQFVGRSTRPLPGTVDGLRTAEERKAAIAASKKPFTRIIDFVGNSGKHKLIYCSNILGGNVTEEAAEIANAKAIESGSPKLIMVSMTNAQLELDKKREEERKRLEAEKDAEKARIMAKSKYHVQDVDPFNSKDVMKISGSTWARDGKQFSPPQAAILTKLKVDMAKISYVQGQAIISDYKSKPTKGQIRKMISLGLSESDWKGLDLRDASQLIDRKIKEQ